jgi:hypothetical protein
MRVMISTIWYQGLIWKLPLPVSGGLPPCGERYRILGCHPDQASSP